MRRGQAAAAGLAPGESASPEGEVNGGGQWGRRRCGCSGWGRESARPTGRVLYIDACALTVDGEVEIPWPQAFLRIFPAILEIGSTAEENSEK